MDIIIDISNTVLETDRLILRAWKESDLNDFYEYASTPGLGEMAGFSPHKSIDISKSVLQSFILHKNEFAVVEKLSNKVIGSVGLQESWANNDSPYSNFKMKNIGYVLSKPYWGKGLMPEAVKSVITFCFKNYDLEALTCGHIISNNQSKRVIEKCGFTYVKQTEYFDSCLQMNFSGMRYILFKNQFLFPHSV